MLLILLVNFLKYLPRMNFKSLTYCQVHLQFAQAKLRPKIAKELVYQPLLILRT